MSFKLVLPRFIARILFTFAPAATMNQKSSLLKTLSSVSGVLTGNIMTKAQEAERRSGFEESGACRIEADRADRQSVKAKETRPRWIERASVRGVQGGQRSCASPHVTYHGAMLQNHIPHVAGAHDPAPEDADVLTSGVHRTRNVSPHSCRRLSIATR